MASSMFCCVRNCTTARDKDRKVILHSFPNPDTDGDRFRAWLYSIGGDLLVLDSQFIYKNRKVCHKHFETKYQTRSSRLSANAVPTLHLKGLSLKRPFSDISNKTNNSMILTEPSTSGSVQKKLSDYVESDNSTSTSAGNIKTTEPSGLPEKPETGDADDPIRPVDTGSNMPRAYETPAQPSTSKDSSVEESLTSQGISLKQQAAKTEEGLNLLSLKRKIKKIQAKKITYAQGLKKAVKLSENITFQKCLQKFTTLAALFTLMQCREISKPKMGRRFSREEKIMSLSLYKQGPKAYRWLRKIFVLPSPITLSRLVSGAGLGPGLNRQIFKQLKKRALSMSEDEKLCMLLFDEISITPHFDLNKKRDSVTGFVTNGQKTRREIADHAPGLAWIIIVIII